MDQPEPTLADVIDLIKGVETRLGERIGGVETKVDGLIEFVEGMAKGHNERFSAIEKRLEKVEEHIGLPRRATPRTF